MLLQGSCLDPAGVEDAAESHSAYRAAALLASFPFPYISFYRNNKKAHVEAFSYETFHS